ncbi:MAG: ATP-binding protein [Gammaproteobacteria bacterium]|nr:ATP-binding protein [Gammaproteobacteria bacterium]
MFVKPPKKLLRPVGRAIADFAMIRAGDRILIAVSGGKDSLSLLHTLRHFQRHAPISFDLAAITIDPQSADFDPSPLKDYMHQLGVPYHYVSEPIVELAAEHMHRDSFCAFCSRMRRGLMYKTARQGNYNVLALGQHLDDLAESFLLSALHGGQLRTMKAHYVNDDGDIRIIRPFVYVRERQLREFAGHAALPVIEDNCPACFAKPTQRQHMKQLLAAQEADYPQTFKTLLSTLKPLMAQGLPEDDNSGEAPAEKLAGNQKRGYLRQKPGVNNTSRVNISNRPSNIARHNNHLAKSLIEA